MLGRQLSGILATAEPISDVPYYVYDTLPSEYTIPYGDLSSGEIGVVCFIRLNAPLPNNVQDAVVVLD